MASSGYGVFEHEQILWGDEPDYGPPRCICGRFVSEWGIVHDECRARRMASSEYDNPRYDKPENESVQCQACGSYRTGCNDIEGYWCADCGASDADS